MQQIDHSNHHQQEITDSKFDNPNLNSLMHSDSSGYQNQSHSFKLQNFGTHELIGPMQPGGKEGISIKGSIHSRGRVSSKVEFTNRSQKKYEGALKVTCIDNRNYIRMPNFSKRQVSQLKEWLHVHMDNPYPSHHDKDLLCRETGLSRRQIQNWFTNARKVSYNDIFHHNHNLMIKMIHDLIQFMFINVIDESNIYNIRFQKLLCFLFFRIFGF